MSTQLSCEYVPRPEFEWRSHLMRGRFAFKVLVKQSALPKQRRVTDRAAGIGGRPPAAGGAVASNVRELAPFLCRAKRRYPGRDSRLRLSQLALEGGVLTLDVGEPGLECGKAVLDGRACARRRDHSQRMEEADRAHLAYPYWTRGYLGVHREGLREVEEVIIHLLSGLTRSSVLKP